MVISKFIFQNNMKAFTTCLAFFLRYAVIAQVSTSIDIRPPSGQGYGMVNYNNPSAVGEQKSVEVNNDEISGSPFWKNDWNKAYIFLTSGNIIKLNQVKLNFQTNEIYFLDSNHIIKAAGEQTINKIIFIDKNDSLKTVATFQKLHYDGHTFFQVFNGGDYQLLKAVNASVTKRDYNTLLGKDEYAYNLIPVYYLLHTGQITKIDVFNKAQLGTIIYFKLPDNNWLEQNKNKLRTESDWVSFLNYYNNRLK